MYRYNRDTCQYEPVMHSWKYFVFKTFLFLSVSLSFAIVIYVIVDTYFDSYKVKALKQRYSFVVDSLESIGAKMNENSALLKELKYRDTNLYRMLLMVDPPKSNNRDDDTWHMSDNSSDEDMIRDLDQKIDRLQRKLLDQQKSYVYLQKLAMHNKKYLSSLPAIFPVSRGFIVSGFGYRTHPVFKTRRLHRGVDIMTKVNEPIYATGDGIVIEVNDKGDYGNQVVIDHTPDVHDKHRKIKTRYAHMNKILVSKQQKVKRGQIIGRAGKTGVATGVHVHYEVFNGMGQVDPIPYFIGNLSPAEYGEIINQASNSVMSLD